jgi:hypothetical protein
MASHLFGGRWISLCAGAIFLVGLTHADAGKPIYSYVDEQWNLVATDRWEDIPEHYRGRIKVTESIENPTREGGGVPQLGRAEERLVQLIDRWPATIIPGLSTYQSVMLISGFLAMLLFYGSAKLTNSAFLRLLMPWAVGFLALATVYFMFVSDLSDKVAARSATKSSGSLVHQFQEKGKHLEEQKQGRLKQFDLMTDRE